MLCFKFNDGIGVTLGGGNCFEIGLMVEIGSGLGTGTAVSDTVPIVEVGTGTAWTVVVPILVTRKAGDGLTVVVTVVGTEIAWVVVVGGGGAGVSSGLNGDPTWIP